MPFLSSSPEPAVAVANGLGITSTDNHSHSLFVKANIQSIPHKVINDSTNSTKAKRLAPPSKWNVLCHGLEKQIIANAEGYVIDNWKWPSEKIKGKVRAVQFGRAAALVFPFALDDRIEIMCKLCMILVLVDDILDHLSHTDGKAYNERLVTVMSGLQPANNDIPAERLLSDLWSEMRQQDPLLADQLLQGTIAWFAGMTESDRSSHHTLGAYLDYRERDVGMDMLSAMVRYAMDIHLTEAELALIRPIERNFVRQYCAVNDVCSWEKEVKVAQASQQEGAKIVSAVQILADEMSLPVAGAKRMLWAMAREYSDCHDEMASAIEMAGCSDGVRRYLDGMRYLMSGNEEWCLTSARYNDDVKL